MYCNAKTHYFSIFGKSRNNRNRMVRIKKGGRLEEILFELELIKQNQIKDEKRKNNG